MALVTCSSLVIHDPDDDDPDPVTGVSAAVSPRVSLWYDGDMGHPAQVRVKLVARHIECRDEISETFSEKG